MTRQHQPKKTHYFTCWNWTRSIFNRGQVSTTHLLWQRSNSRASHRARIVVQTSLCNRGTVSDNTQHAHLSIPLTHALTRSVVWPNVQTHSRPNSLPHTHICLLSNSPTHWPATCTTIPANPLTPSQQTPGQGLSTPTHPFISHHTPSHTHPFPHSTLTKRPLPPHTHSHHTTPCHSPDGLDVGFECVYGLLVDGLTGDDLLE